MNPEYIIGSLLLSLLVGAFAWLWLSNTDNRKEIRKLENNTYTKSEVIEHIILRVDPLQQKVAEMHKDVKEIKNLLMRR